MSDNTIVIDGGCNGIVKVVRVVISKCASGPTGPAGAQGVPGTTGVNISALMGIVGGGTPDDPIDGYNSFQSNKLIGVSVNNGGRLRIEYAEDGYSSWGANASFTFDNMQGRITWTNGNTFSLGNSLWINLNQ